MTIEGRNIQKRWDRRKTAGPSTIRIKRDRWQYKTPEEAKQTGIAIGAD